MKRFVFFVVAMVLIVLFSLPEAAFATTRVVVKTEDQCPADTTTTPCYLNLDGAITDAVDGDSLKILPGSYSTNLSITRNINSIYGTETARTFISAPNSSGTALNITNLSASIEIRNLTFINSAVGINVQSTTGSVLIKNNVFAVGSNTGRIAIQITGTTSSPEIVNNTFSGNFNAVVTDITTAKIKSNIFSSTQSTVLSSAIAISGILNNLFFNYGNIGPTSIIWTTTDPNYNGNIKDVDPRFVFVSTTDQTLSDFHLLEGSPCINTGYQSDGRDVVDDTDPDMGAYGGPLSDTFPHQVLGVTYTKPSETSITVSWSPNNAYTVTGYRLYYGTTTDYTGADATEGSSPISISTRTTTSATLSGLSSAVTPSSPTVSDPSPRDGTLVLTWTAVPNATGYKIYYSTSSFTTDTNTLPANPITINDGSITSYALTGLTNYTDYYTAVSAISQRIYYIAVTAVDGKLHESTFSSPPLEVGAGEVKESEVTLFKPDFPEPLVAYPNLPNKGQGCFIATAAYGYYSESHVQALRLFRDRYLLTNGPGRAFVGWYYTHGPAAAAWLIDHPAYKPLVRAALLPAVGVALFLTKMPLAVRIGLIMAITGLFAYVFYRRRSLHRGGSC